MTDVSIHAWLNSLSSRTPAPGGGAATGLTAATAAGLASMVASYTTGERWLDKSDRMQEIDIRAAGLRLRALELMRLDEEAFEAVGAAYGLAKEDPTRREKIQISLRHAADPPVAVGGVVVELLEILRTLAGEGNPNVVSDVAIAAAMADAALISSIVNIEINQKLISNDEFNAQLSSKVALFESASEQAKQIITTVRKELKR